jgi:hypothetical protein
LIFARSGGARRNAAPPGFPNMQEAMVACRQLEEAMTRFGPWSVSLLVAAAAVAAACVPPVFATTLAAPAAHAHEAGGATGLRLDHGRKWASDAPLRAGMTRIRALVAPQLAPAHAGKLAPADYQALARKVEAEVGTMVANCKLPPESDAVLHVVLAQVLAGTATMDGRTAGAKAPEGLVQVVAAVNDYGRHFEHPGWKAIPLPAH